MLILFALKAPTWRCLTASACSDVMWGAVLGNDVSYSWQVFWSPSVGGGSTSRHGPPRAPVAVAVAVEGGGAAGERLVRQRVAVIVDVVEDAVHALGTERRRSSAAAVRFVDVAHLVVIVIVIGGVGNGVVVVVGIAGVAQCSRRQSFPGWRWRRQGSCR